MGEVSGGEWGGKWKSRGVAEMYAIDWGDVLFSLGVSVFYGRMTDHHKFSGRVT